MIRLAAVSEDLGKAHDRHGRRSDDVRQDLPRANRRQLVDVAHNEERRVVGHRPQ